MNDQRKDSRDDARRPSWGEVVGSVFAAFFGVQSEKNRARDFTHGRPAAYIVVGLLMTLALVLVLWGIVRIILHQAGL